MGKKVLIPPTKEAANGKWEEYVFLLTIFLACTCMSDQLVDRDLLPRFLALGGLLAVVMVFFVFRQGSLSFSWNAVTVSGMLYGLLAIASVAWALVSSEALFHGSRVFLSLLFLALGIWLLKRNPSLFQRISYLVLGIVLLYLLIATMQMANLKRIDENSIYDIYGLSAHRNLFSSFLFLAIPFLVQGAVSSRTYWKYIFILCLVGSFFFVVILQTRAVWLGTCIAVLASAFLLLRMGKSFWSLKKVVGAALLLAVSVSLVVLALVKYQFWEQFSERWNIGNYGQSQSVQERFQQWNSTWKIAKEHPLLGVGAGNWPFYFPKFTLVGNQEALEGITFQRPHNDFLWVLSELGIVGLVSYLLLFLVPIFYAFKSCWKEAMDTDHMIMGMVASFLFGFLALSFFDFPRERIELLVLSFLLLGFLCSKVQLPAFKVVEIKWKYVALLLLPLLVFSLVVGVARWRGEKAVHKLHAAKDRKDWEAVNRISSGISSTYFQVEPASMPLAWYQGLAQCQLGDYKGGLSSLQEAYRLAPYNYLVLNNMGICYSQLEQTQQAKSFFQEALRINPTYDEARLNLALLYYVEKEYTRALELVNQAKESPRKEKYRMAILPLLKR